MIFTQEYRKYWKPEQRLTFRFVFSYFLLFVFFTFFSGYLVKPIFWIGLRILKLKIEVHETVYSTGSGDTAFMFTTYFIALVAAVFTTVFWSFCDRKRQSYNQLFYWFTLALRVFLILMMFQYGFEKVFKTQFRTATNLRLLQPLSEFSPMGLAWTYFGFSRAFNFIIGATEILAALLLIPRRTQTLGALTTFGVMLHVTVMNFIYDVPVKLFALHLTIFAGVLLATDLRRLGRIFILNRFVDRVAYYHPFGKREKAFRLGRILMKTLATLGLLCFFGFYGYRAERTKGDKQEKPLLHGIWETTVFVRNGDTLPPLITDEYRWRYLVIDFDEKASVKRMTDSITPYTFLVDISENKISMFEKGGDSVFDNLHYSLNGDQLQLRGALKGDTLDINFVEKDISEFTLYSREFQWISEHPYNR
ncbi:MAG: hypothetical protein WBG71_13015 [Leeuwenhoekiella sp.]